MVCSNAPAENEGGADSAYAGLVVIATVSGSAGGFIHEARYGSAHAALRDVADPVRFFAHEGVKAVVEEGGA